LKAPRAGGENALTLACLLHPTPALSGFPHQAAKQLIAELEPFDRELFGGIVGWCDDEGNGEWVVTIRCARCSSRAPVCGRGHCSGLLAAGRMARNRRQTDHHAERFWLALRSNDDHSFTRWPEEFAARYREKATGRICR
jgi:anthranilate/para-aminobenzoate synthase component I